jgi:hypothetical protein
VAFIRPAAAKGGVAPASGCDTAYKGENARMPCYALCLLCREVAMTDSLKVALAQLNPKVGDVNGNLAKVRAARAEVRKQGAELVIHHLA